MWRGVVACVGSLCAVVSCGDGGGSGPLLPARIANLQRAFDTALSECADRVWPGSAASYRSSQILLVSVEEGTAYLWNDQREAANGRPTQLSLVEITELGSEWLTTFNSGTLFGFPTVGVSLDETAEVNEAYAAVGVQRWHDFAVELTLHEAFHIIGSQPRWARPGGGGSRSIPYPEIAEPRYLRAALASSLLAHVRDGGSDTTLSAAAFWQGRFVTEHGPDADAIRGTDIDEGTAEYATVVGSALVEHGCAASEATLVQTMVAHLDEFVDVARFDGSSEPYQLGLLAGIGARVRGTRLAGWEGRVELGQTPVEVLVAGTVALAQTDDPNPERRRAERSRREQPGDRRGGVAAAGAHGGKRPCPLTDSSPVDRRLLPRHGVRDPGERARKPAGTAQLSGHARSAGRGPDDHGLADGHGGPAGGLRLVTPDHAHRHLSGRRARHRRHRRTLHGE